MSLTSLLKNRDVKDKFREEFPKPRFNLKKEILAPPLTNHYSLVGTAFDYLMRFHLERLNPKAVAHPWVAEHVRYILASGLENPAEVEDDPVRLKAFDKAMYIAEQVNKADLNFTYSDLVTKSADIIKKSKKAYSSYIKSGKMSDELIKSTILLAQLDPIYRAGYVDRNIGIIEDKDVEDLRNLISLVDPKIFKADEICLLNPTFGEASQLVGGADTDLVIDDVMIDIKTTKKLELTRDYFNQIIGYYTLYKIGSVNGTPPEYEVKKLGIYFSRYSHLHVISVQDIIDENAFPRFLEWFKERAGDEFEPQI